MSKCEVELKAPDVSFIFDANTVSLKQIFDAFEHLLFFLGYTTREIWNEYDNRGFIDDRR